MSKFDIMIRLKKAAKAADEAVKPYGFRLCEVNNISYDKGIFYTDCCLICLPQKKDKNNRSHESKSKSNTKR